MKYLAGIDKESAENMEMIIGGAYQGKTVYAKKEYPLLNWADGENMSFHCSLLIQPSAKAGRPKRN